MNEIVIVVHNGDSISDIFTLAKEIAQIPKVSHVLFRFNEVKLFVHKSTTFEELEKDYKQKLRNSAEI